MNFVTIDFETAKKYGCASVGKLLKTAGVEMGAFG